MCLEFYSGAGVFFSSGGDMICYQVEDDSKCGCEFNNLHIIWMVVLGLLVCCGIGFLVYLFCPVGRAMPLTQTGNQPLLDQGSDEYHEYNEVHDDELEKSTGSVLLM